MTGKKLTNGATHRVPQQQRRQLPLAEPAQAARWPPRHLRGQEQSRRAPDRSGGAAYGRVGGRSGLGRDPRDCSAAIGTLQGDFAIRDGAMADCWSLANRMLWWRPAQHIPSLAFLQTLTFICRGTSLQTGRAPRCTSPHSAQVNSVWSLSFEQSAADSHWLVSKCSCHAFPDWGPAVVAPLPSLPPWHHASRPSAWEHAWKPKAQPRPPMLVGVLFSHNVTWCGSALPARQVGGGCKPPLVPS